MLNIKKNKKIKIKNNNKNDESYNYLINEINKYENIIQKTILSVNNYKSKKIITSSELHICISNMENLFNKLLKIKNNMYSLSQNDIINKLQQINNELYDSFKLFGTMDILDVLFIIFGDKYKSTIKNNDLFEIFKRYTHPVSFKLLSWKDKNKKNNKIISKNKIVEDFMLIGKADTLDCFDLARTSNNFYIRVYGIKIVFQNIQKRKTLIISCVIDNISIQFLNCIFINNKINNLLENIPNDIEYEKSKFLNFLNKTSFKNILIYSNDELYKRYIGNISQIKLIKQKTVSQNIKEFITNDLYNQRKTLILLLIDDDNYEQQYLAYLLYDLLSNENSNSIDTIEQILLYDSLPWNIKKSFKQAMKSTIKYTKNLSNFDTSQIPIEQQICLMKVNDSVKEKAMIKLKEVKAKSEDSGSKARQYLDGLLKIPFGIYKKENILCKIKNMNDNYKNIVNYLENNYSKIKLNFKKKNYYTNIELTKNINYIEKTVLPKIKTENIKNLIELLTNNNRKMLINNICNINSILKKHEIKNNRLCHSGKKTLYMKDSIKNLINKLKNNDLFIKDVNSFVSNKQLIKTNIVSDIITINNDSKYIQNSMKNISSVLDKSVYGHKNAKRQIERIIGQWITGEQKGYCFGFEGPPGIGKTSLARHGLSYCLEDDDGSKRPFSFIALGGSSNGSTLAGHSYTYVGSTWGRIVDILIETKCMNPIIFIDELDKISNTEQGREIIGILTHLVDSTQNECFQDKYFSGIDINLSNALFIFSYNDPNSIDKILLDRIHRIKFDNLTINDKIEITKRYLLPDIYKKMGVDDSIVFNDDIIKYIINNYTYESGVRKLKQILFEIVSEINLQMLQSNINEIPIILNKDNIKYTYLKNKTEIKHKSIPKLSKPGIINGLWANSLGMGGIIPIECSFYPTNTFLEFKLTGLQGDVMKESMNVAKTLAWNLTPLNIQKSLLKKFEKTKLQGIHIHCPEGAVPKDGPSAGTAITIAIYSLFNNKKIKNNIAITGEINLQGNVTAIGGLELKILGGIRDGVTEFIYPEDNEKDFKKFLDKKLLIKNKNIKFHKLNNIKDVLKKVFIK
jgi:ATP-dependent Lon protease